MMLPLIFKVYLFMLHVVNALELDFQIEIAKHTRKSLRVGGNLRQLFADAAAVYSYNNTWLPPPIRRRFFAPSTMLPITIFAD